MKEETAEQKTNFKVIPYDSVPEELKEKVSLLKKACFNREKENEEKRAEGKDRFCSDGDAFRYLIALENNSVIGLAILFKRDNFFKTQKINLGGLGEVCVREDKRKKGIATKLIKLGMEELKKENCDVAYLCTDVNNSGMVSLYGEVGFVPLGKKHTYLGKSGKRYFDSDGMIARVNSPVVFSAVLKDTKPFDIGVGNW